jgi:hypothetical protein
MTACRGASFANGPPRPVGTAFIRSTTYMPWTTRPNTAYPPARYRGLPVIQKRVIGNVDEELRSGRMWIAGTRHGEESASVLQAIGRFVLDRGLGLFLPPLGCVSSPLDHEPIDHAVENRAIIKALTNIGQPRSGETFHPQAQARCSLGWCATQRGAFPQPSRAQRRPRKRKEKMGVWYFFLMPFATSPQADA